MTIKVRFFASLRESIGTGEKIIESQDAMSAVQVWNVCTQKSELPSNILVAINQEYVKSDTMVKSGDEVAFFPPVTGG
jgi:molybdopterin synthase sulfur carrier subunit